MKERLPVGFMFKQINNIYEKEFNNLLRGIGITSSQCAVLDYLLGSSKEFVNQKDIEKALSLKNPTVTGILKRLDEKGFILAVPSNQDKRCKNIYPTEKAYDIQKKMDNYRKKIDRRLTIGMSKKEIAALEKMLDRVLYNIRTKSRETGDVKMSYADKVFINMCRDIIDNGTDTRGEKVRPVWKDGTPAYTIKKFGVVNRYDLSKEFPALTLRRTAIKSCTDELLWIWQQKSNNINDLHSHIWDSWADEDGSIGKAYGYQMGVKHQYKEGMFDQVDRVIYDLKNNPYSRRIMTNIYVHQDLHEMNLYPCAYSMTFNVTKKPGHDKLTLNAILNQRSNDVLAANNWNVCQYAVLIHMLAQVCDMEVGEFVHVIADAHIYDRHVPMIEELISREPLPAPQFWLNPEIRDFYQFTRDDVKLIDYQTHDQIKNIPVAV